eukprot:1377175-Amorphochlora_amoeboformis.AAC.1
MCVTEGHITLTSESKGLFLFVPGTHIFRGTHFRYLPVSRRGRRCQRMAENEFRAFNRSSLPQSSPPPLPRLEHRQAC